MRVAKLAAVSCVTALLVLLATCLIVLRWGVGAVPFGPALATSLGGKLFAAATLTSADGEPAASETAELVVLSAASGDVTATSAVVWARASRGGELAVTVTDEEGLQARVQTASGVEERDYTLAVRFDGLSPDTPYVYEVHAPEPGASNIAEAAEEARSAMRRAIYVSAGRFRTAPDPSAHADLSFVFSGDLAGGGYCRRVDTGYPIFEAMRRLASAFFIATGDMIYADNECTGRNPDGAASVPSGFASVASIDWSTSERVREEYFRHWRYNRADQHLQDFLRTTPTYVLWDDHETINDSGSSWSYWNPLSASRPGYPTLATAARDAFFAYAPLVRDPADPNRIYRRFAWGADADFFLLDTRSYRSRNDAADTPENQKTMLGAEQLAWLKRGLVESTATWKIVATSVPLSIPTGGAAAAILGRDAWANGTSWDYSSQTGFERELLDLLRSLDGRGVRNVVFLSGDAHQALNIRYEIDADRDGQALVFHEIVAGPLSSSPGRAEPQLDPTLNPTLLYREGGFFNFGYARVERDGDGIAHFVTEIRGEDGEPRAGSRLDLTPR